MIGDGGRDGRGTPVDRAPALIAGLTGVRALMGLWVIADHLGAPTFALLPVTGLLRPVLSGGVALDAFFVLSGFVVSHVYAHRLATLDRRSVGGFLWARVARLYPTHLFALLVMAALIAWSAWRGTTASPGVTHSVWTFLGNVAMLHAVPGIDAWNPPAWSVSTEVAAYLLLPLAAPLLVRLSRRAAVVLAGAVVLATEILLFAFAGTSVLVDAFWVRPVGEVALGCALWAAWRHAPRRRHHWDVVALLSFAGVVLVAATQSGLLRFLTVPLLGLFVVAVAKSAGVVLTALTSRPVEWAGRTSYSRYLLHVPALTALTMCVPLGPVLGASLGARIALVVAWYVAVFAVGGLVYAAVEEPARRRLRRLGRGSGPHRPRPGPRPTAPVEPVGPADAVATTPAGP